MTEAPELDEAQRTVVGLPDYADAVVLGAAGTGKTLVAVELLAHRVLDSGWDPADVLVIGADRHVASRLRDRIVERLGLPVPGGMVRTAQSLANSIVLDHAKTTGMPLPLYLSGADHDRIIRELLEQEPLPEELGEHRDADAAGSTEWPSDIPRATRALPAFRSELRALLAEAAARGLGPEALIALGERHARPAWSAAGRFMRRLGERIEHDHPDFTPLDAAFVLRRAAELVEAGVPGSPRPRLIIIDDAHELVPGALRLLRALAAQVPLDRRVVRLVLLGDPDLATGGFRGARPGAFAGEELWRGLGAPQRHVLGRDHRHGPSIAAALSRIISRIGVTGEAPHRTPVPGRGAAVTDAVAAVRVADPAEQAAYLARALRERHVHGAVPWPQLGVIVRTAASATRIARELRALQVPAASAGSAAVAPDDYAIRGLTLPIEIALGMTELDASTAEELLTGSLGRIDVVALRRLRVGLRLEALKADRDASAKELLLEAMRTPAAFAVVDTPTARRARHVAEVLERVRVAALGRASIQELLWTVWDGSGLAAEWGEAAFGSGVAADEANRHLDIVVELFAAAGRYVERHPEGAAEAFLRSWLEASVRQDTLARRAATSTVFVGTPAQAIGREFDTVLLAELEEGIWPDLRVRGSLLGVPDLIDVEDGLDPAVLDRRRAVLHDELRLLAAAASRARTTLIGVSVVGEDRTSSPFLRLLAPDGEVHDAGPAAVTPLTLRALTARLRRELTQPRGVHADSPTARERAAARSLAHLAAAGIPGADPAEWYGLQPATTTAPLTADGEPVRVSPSTIDRFGTCELHWVIEHLGGIGANLGASVGTIVHAVAETIADETVDEVLPGVLERLDDLDIEADWLREAETRRARALLEHLVAYQRDLDRAGATTIGRELRFELGAGRALVRGRIDRIERTADDLAIVVDFKTGKEHGIGSAASVAEHAQLATYQLAVREGALRDETGEAVELAVRGGGAQLVILSRTTATTEYVTATQPPLDDETAAVWRERIAETAERMAGTVFIARVEHHCSSRYAYGPCRIHIVPEVSA